mmetsp:Transcript_29205/g.67010  ORF Transcript_29205/g.67010 Transcript_29205/m.67010 type:complete len:186 (+) Transcript_29205:338-895(+)
MGKRPGRAQGTPTTTEARGPAVWPVKHAQPRFYPEKLVQKYQCWRPETLGNVSQWGDGPGVHGRNPVESKGALMPYFIDGRGGRRQFPALKRSASNIPSSGPFEDAQGKEIDYSTTNNGGPFRSRMFANVDINGQNPYLLAERIGQGYLDVSSHGSPPQRADPVVHPLPRAYNSLGERLSRVELV